MGARASGQCFDTAADAAAAVWSAVGPVVSAGSPPTITVVEWSGSQWQSATYQGGTLLSVQAVPSIAFEVCSPGDAALDGMSLGWLVVGAWAIAWSVNVLRRAMGWGF